MESLRGVHSTNCVGTLYFSDLNRNAVHDAIRYQVYVQTKGEQVIGRQSDTELEVVMRSVYLQFCRHAAEDVVGQVRDLNARVIDFAVPTIIVSLRQYRGYQEDLDRTPRVMDHAVSTSSAGTKFLSLDSF